MLLIILRVVRYRGGISFGGSFAILILTPICVTILSYIIEFIIPDVDNIILIIFEVFLLLCVSFCPQFFLLRYFCCGISRLQAIAVCVIEVLILILLSLLIAFIFIPPDELKHILGSFAAIEEASTENQDNTSSYDNNNTSSSLLGNNSTYTFEKDYQTSLGVLRLALDETLCITNHNNFFVITNAMDDKGKYLEVHFMEISSKPEHIVNCQDLVEKFKEIYSTLLTNIIDSDDPDHLIRSLSVDDDTRQWPPSVINEINNDLPQTLEGFNVNHYDSISTDNQTTVIEYIQSKN